MEISHKQNQVHFIFPFNRPNCVTVDGVTISEENEKKS